MLSYSGSDLIRVDNSLGRSLVFTLSSGRISAVADGNGRSVGYSYDAAGNLTTRVRHFRADSGFTLQSRQALSRVFGEYV